MKLIAYILSAVFILACNSPISSVEQSAKISGAMDSLPARSAKIIVTIDHDQKRFINQTPVLLSQFDSLLSVAIEEHRSFGDSLIVEIKADTSAFYGDIYHIIQFSKERHAKVNLVVH